MIDQLEGLQRETRSRYGVQLDFTGLRPVRTYIERYLTQDLLKTLPFMFLLISLVYYLAFGNWCVMAVAWVLTMGITAFAFSCYWVITRQVPTMVILIPTFTFGLLSDYILHMGYHLQGRSGLRSWRSVRKYLLVPLTLASMTSMVGFLSLVTLSGEGHVLLAVTVGISFAMIYVFALWWLPGVIGPRLEAAGPPKPLVRWWSRATNRVFALIFYRVYKNRRVGLPILLVLAVVAAASVFRLKIQPYPLKQLPDSATVVKAERLLNGRFSGTVPFRLEIEASQNEAFLYRESLRALESVQGLLSESSDIGYQLSILSVVKRINYYFHDSDPQFLAIPEVQDEERFPSLIQQYLLFYSASASPDEYESLIDAGFTTVSIHGILRYRDSTSLDDFQRSLDRITSSAPPGWKIRLSGSLSELIRIKANMERNWYFTFGFGTILIFCTVLVFFRSITMSLISLVPSFCILLVLAGVAPMLNIQVDEYTIVIVGVSTGLTIDYTIHMLNTVRKTVSGRRSWRSVRSFGYALARSGSQPVFLSLLTTILAFVTLFVSSFTGAVHFAFLLCLGMGSAFLISVFLLPLFFLTGVEFPPSGGA